MIVMGGELTLKDRPQDLALAQTQSRKCVVSTLLSRQSPSTRTFTLYSLCP